MVECTDFFSRLLKLREQPAEQHLKMIFQQIQAAAKGLILRQRGKPRSPVVAGNIIDATFLKMTVQLPEQINRHQFGNTQVRLTVAIRLPMKFALHIVKMADEQINFD